LSVSESANLAEVLLELVPKDGRTIGNARLRKALSTHIGREISDTSYFELQRELVDRGLLVTGKGRGEQNAGG
jgi:adenine-specific DNA-methyltransferase